MKYKLANLNQKQIRAAVIARYVKNAGYRGVVAFSCGNATAALREAGLWVLDISPDGMLAPTEKWWTPAEIHAAFPDLFDATSGHLPMYLMIEIARELKSTLGKLPEAEYEVPTGSGETIACLRLAYPSITFTPICGIGKGTEYDSRAPLNDATFATL